MRTDRSFWGVLAFLLGLTVLLIVLGLRFDRHLQTVERQLLERAPTAPPLQTLSTQPESVAEGQAVYVPVYSHVYSGQGQEQALEVTLSLRNTDREQPIIIRSIRYYGNEGTLLQEYLQQPVQLGPLASTDFLVERRDMAGGVGANFLVHWAAEAPVSPPLIEAIMVASEGNKAFAFARPGIPLDNAAETSGEESGAEGSEP